MLKDNLTYFDYSINHPEPESGADYRFIERSSELTKYVQQTQTIKVALVKVQQALNNQTDEAACEAAFRQLFTEFQSEYNQSELRHFLTAYGTGLEKVKKNYDLFKEVTKAYLAKRDLDALTPAHWIQAVMDSHATRKQGTTGESKIKQLLHKQGYEEIDHLDKLDNSPKCFGLCNKKNFDIPFIDNKFNTTFHKHQVGKKLDVLLKNQQHIFLLEAKHLNTLSGGAQSKSMSELLSFIKLNFPTVHLIAFLDGYGSNELLSNPMKPPKAIRQYNTICRTLQKRPQSFWLNTAGFELLLQDLA